MKVSWIILILLCLISGHVGGAGWKVPPLGTIKVCTNLLTNRPLVFANQDQQIEIILPRDFKLLLLNIACSAFPHFLYVSSVFWIYVNMPLSLPTLHPLHAPVLISLDSMHGTVTVNRWRNIHLLFFSIAMRNTSGSFLMVLSEVLSCQCSVLSFLWSISSWQFIIFKKKKKTLL